jgi:hypothetical protein
LQLFASVIPVQADSTVRWSVSNLSVAQIDEKGLLTAVSNGLVTVKATARDGSAVFGSKDITVTMVTGLQNTEWAQLILYPNPATNQLTINSGQIPIKGVMIRDLLGKTVFRDDEPFTGTKSFDLTLKKGIYLILFTGTTNSYKLIVI